jgi:hypothetical protein
MGEAANIHRASVALERTQTLLLGGIQKFQYIHEMSWR